MNKAYMELLAQYKKVIKAYSKGANVSISDAAELIRPGIVRIFEEKLKKQEQNLISAPAVKRKRRVTR